MRTVSEHLREHLFPTRTRMPDYDSLLETEWSSEFEWHMRRNLAFGALRHGLIGAPGKPQYDRMTSILRRLIAYRRDKNAEHLVDIANLCLLEYVEGEHNGFSSQCDHALHTEVKDGHA